MRTIILKLNLDGEDEYEYQDVSTLLVVEDFVLRHLPKETNIQIISDSIDKSGDGFGLESCPPEFQQTINDEFWSII